MALAQPECNDGTPRTWYFDLHRLCRTFFAPFAFGNEYT